MKSDNRTHNLKNTVEPTISDVFNNHWMAENKIIPFELTNFTQYLLSAVSVVELLKVSFNQQIGLFTKLAWCLRQ